MTDNEKIKLALLVLLDKAEKGRESSWHRADYWLRKYSIRGRSQSCPDQLRSNRQRSLPFQQLRQWRVK